MRVLTSLVLLLSINMMLAQKGIPTKAINGTYYLLEAERGALDGGTTKTKLIEFGENNGTKLLAIAACKKCIPAVYTYQPEVSKKLGKAIFFNSSGLYVIQYDDESFINVLVTNRLGDAPWTRFMFSNFYSKNKSTVATMTKEKIEEYARSISKK